MKYKEGDIIVVVENKYNIYADINALPVGLITKVLIPYSLLIIYGNDSVSYDLKWMMEEGLTFRHATDREKFLYYTHGVMVLEE